MAVRYKIYGKPNCVHCTSAKHLLDSYGRPYEYIDISNNIDTFRKQFPEARTVPQITLGDKYIGGYTQLEAHCRETW